VKTEIATAVNSHMVGTGIQTGTLTTTSSGECAGAGTQLEVDAAYSFAALPGLAGLQSSITLSAH
jgi:hypothetical protein